MNFRDACIGAVALTLLVGCESGGATGSGRGGARSPREVAESPHEENIGPAGGAAGAAGAVSQEDADRCLLRGRAALEAKEYVEAERRLKVAWDADARADIAADLGRVEVALGKVGEAGAYLSAAIDGGVAAAEAQLAGLRPKLGSVALKPPAAGAEVSVFIDGWRATHRVPRAELWLAPGRHDVEMRAGARIVAKKTLDIEVGKRLDWDAAIDGKVDLAAPVASLRGNLDPNLNAKVPSASAGLSVPLLVVGGIVGTIAVAVGTGFAVAASNLHADIGKIQTDLKVSAHVDLPCEGANRAANEAQCSLIDAKLKSEKVFLKAGIPLLVVAGLIVGGGITYIVWPRAKAPEAKVEICGVKIEPSIGPGSVSLHGTF